MGAGKWIRFTLLTIVSIESRYWTFERTRTDGLNFSWSHRFPSSLTSKLEKYLASCDDLKQDFYLTASVGKSSSDYDKGRNDSELLVNWSRPSFRVNERLQSITNMVYHWSDCPRYFDKAVIQRPWSTYRPTNSFSAYIDHRWVLVSRFGSEDSHLDRDCYILRALHRLRESSEITPLLGVLLDQDSGLVTGYLCDLPAAGMLCRIVTDAVESGRPIAWARREKWCRQIVQGVAKMHDSDLVVGRLAEAPDAGIGIDANDNAVFFGRF